MFKVTNCFQYLHYSSAHPRSVFRGIIKGEATSVLRASSDKSTYHTVIKKLQMDQQARCYPKHLLHRCFSEVPFTNRGHLLDQNEATDDAQPANPPQPTLVIDFNSNILKKHLKNGLLPPTGFPSTRIAYEWKKYFKFAGQSTAEQLSITTSQRDSHAPARRYIVFFLDAL